MASAYSIRCPACGQLFLATQTRMATVTTCPHCAFNGPLEQFTQSGAQTLGTATALPLKRRVLRPPGVTDNAPSATPPPPPAQPPLPVLPAMPEPAPVPAPEPIRAAPTRPAIRERSSPVTMRAAAVPGQEALWPGLQTDRPVDPAMPQPNPPPAPPPRPASGARTFWWLLTLGLLIFTASGFVIWNHLQQPPPAATGAVPPNEEIRRPSADPVDLAVSVDSTRPDFSVDQQIAIQKLSVEVPDALRDWFAPSQTLDQRLAFVHNGEQYREQVAAFFAQEPSLSQVQRYPIFPTRLPEMQPVPLFQVATSANDGGGLALFIAQPDGGVKLDWPLFRETHEQVLSQYVANSDGVADPRWFHVGLRRSHGLELSKDLRERLHAFDLQASPTGTARVIAYSGRDLPVGRFLDRLTDWNVIYLAELLMKIEVLDDGDPALMILDCRGAGLATGDR